MRGGEGCSVLITSILTEAPTGWRRGDGEEERSGTLIARFLSFSPIPSAPPPTWGCDGVKVSFEAKRTVLLRGCRTSLDNFRIPPAKEERMGNGVYNRYKRERQNKYAIAQHYSRHSSNHHHH